MPKGNLKKEVADNIRKIRKRLKLTQEQAADEAGFHYKYYQKIEGGSVNLTLDSLERIAKSFGISPRKLI